MKISLSKNTLVVLIALLASAAMLTVVQPPIGWSVLAWVCLVPFILACSSEVKSSSLFIGAYIISYFYWLGNLYWLKPVTAAGWIALCFYMAVFWPLVGICLRFCMAKKVPLFLAVPVLVVGAERSQGIFLGGFFWRYLSHSQYANIPLIQISDIFGAAGVSFLIVMVNGLIADWIISRHGVRTKFAATFFVSAAVAGTLIYGNWRISESGKFIEQGPKVASVQTNIPQSVKESHEASEEILEEMLKNNSSAAKAGVVLVVWPETMVQAILDDRVLKVVDSSHQYNVFDKILKKCAKDGNAYILVGAHGGMPRINTDLSIELGQRYNSAYLYRPDGTKFEKEYNKINLVPFGEVVPFKKSFPLLYRVFMKFSPYDYDYSLDYGSEYTIFEVNDFRDKPSRVYKFGVMICYEDSVSQIARKFVLAEQGGKTVDWLVNISNDGWFVQFSGDKIFPSAELSQHTAICVFRAVENRIAVLRSVNTGISCLIDSLGRVKDGYISGDLPQEAMARQGMAGWFTDRISIDKRITFFSKYGQWLDFCCAVVFMSIIIVFLGIFFQKKIYRSSVR